MDQQVYELPDISIVSCNMASIEVVRPTDLIAAERFEPRRSSV